jgi:hypothetical protein
MNLEKRLQKVEQQTAPVKSAPGEDLFAAIRRLAEAFDRGECPADMSPECFAELMALDAAQGEGKP